MEEAAGRQFARQLKLGADRARQRTDMEMLDGTEVVTAVDGPEAVPVAEDDKGWGWKSDLE